MVTAWEITVATLRSWSRVPRTPQTKLDHWSRCRVDDVLHASGSTSITGVVIYTGDADSVGRGGSNPPHLTKDTRSIWRARSTSGTAKKTKDKILRTTSAPGFADAWSIVSTPRIVSIAGNLRTPSTTMCPQFLYRPGPAVAISYSVHITTVALRSGDVRACHQA